MSTNVVGRRPTAVDATREPDRLQSHVADPRPITGEGCSPTWRVRPITRRTSGPAWRLRVIPLDPRSSPHHRWEIRSQGIPRSSRMAYMWRLWWLERPRTQTHCTLGRIHDVICFSVAQGFIISHGAHLGLAMLFLIADSATTISDLARRYMHRPR